MSAMWLDLSSKFRHLKFRHFMGANTSRALSKVDALYQFTCIVALMFVVLSLSACYVPQYQAEQVQVPVATSKSTEATTVYVYPAQGQSQALLDRDRYECNVWAVKQTGYDPSQLHTGAERVTVVAGPLPGTSVATGAVTGAVLGAAVARPHQEAGGAIIGGIAGAMIGAAADAARQEQVTKVQQAYDQQSDAALLNATNYRRAISACLESRGYTVK